MSHKRISLQEAQRLYSQDLARCNGYLWHLGTRIGKGSFGEVYLGWTSVREYSVAVCIMYDVGPEIVRPTCIDSICSEIVGLCH